LQSSASFCPSLPPNFHCTWRDPLAPQSRISPVLPGLEKEEEKQLSSHRGKSCPLQRLDLDPNPNVKRVGRGKKTSIKYKRMVREKNETQWLPLSWLD